MGTRLFTRGGLAMACAGLLALSLTLRLLCVAQPVGAALQNALSRLAALRERVGICETEGAAAMQSEAPVTAAGFEAEPATEASGIEREASMAAAVRLTAAMAEVFPDDPLKGDFALFGHGLNESR